MFCRPHNVDALKRNAVNGLELTEIAGTSHYPMIETPDLFNKLLNHTDNKRKLIYAAGYQIKLDIVMQKVSNL
jgi:hypothetical protein